MFHVHRSERSDLLLSALTRVLAQPLSDALETEIVSVPSRGIERWISQGVAHELGVSANISFPSPQALVEQVITRVRGIERRDDPWLNGEFLWAVGDAIDANAGAEWIGLVASQLSAAGGVAQSGRVATCEYVRDLFRRYHWLRPDMIQQWQHGSDVGPTGEPLAEQFAWQPRLWREVRKGLDSPSPPELLGLAVDALLTNDLKLELPDRISVFGLTRMPISVMSVLAALATTRDVHVFALHPSWQLWDRVAATGSTSSDSTAVITRQADTTRDLARNPLLASWGRDSREMQLVLSGHHPSRQHHYSLGAGESRNNRSVRDRNSSERSARLLPLVQSDVRANRSVAESQSRRSSAASPGGETATNQVFDSSLQVHSCHGRLRQVEVLRDAILHQFELDPSLEPRDVIIMCPDVEAFVPHIEAVFGELPELRVRVADRSAAVTNPLASATVQLLELAESRCTASDVLNLLSTEPVRERFGLTNESLARIEQWTTQTNVRWGLDGRHRQRLGMPERQNNTWSAGLARVLAGVAMAQEDQRLVDEVLPLDDVSSTDIEVAGALAEFVARLRVIAEQWAGPFDIRDGVGQLAHAIDDLFAVPEPMQWQRTALHAELDQLLVGASTGDQRIVSLGEFRNLVGDALAARPTRANFRTGHITVCTLTPMRSVPHRIVCILGLDDGAFPRKGRTSGDDLTSAQPLVGDYDVRGEDRQLLLDALLSAEDSLIITYSGRDEVTNLKRPPAVPLAELLTVLQTLCGAAKPEALVVEHPLQPFDVSAFTRGALIPNASWSFDSDAFEGACAGRAASASVALDERKLVRATNEVGAEPPRLADIRSVSVAELVEFFQHPVRYYFEHNLNLRLNDENAIEEPARTRNEISAEVTALEQWSIGGRLLDLLEQTSADGWSSLSVKWQRAEVASGLLPPGEMGLEELRRLYREVLPVAKISVRRKATGPPATRSIRALVPDGLMVYGSVSSVFGTTIIDSTFSRLVDQVERAGPRLRAKTRIANWIRLLALAASYPEEQFRCVMIGRGSPHDEAESLESDGAVQVVVEAPPNPGELLGELVRIFRQGMTEPIKLFPETSSAATMPGDPEFLHLADAWDSRWRKKREDVDPWISRAFPGLTAQGLATDAEFLALAKDVWLPMRCREQVIQGAEAMPDE